VIEPNADAKLLRTRARKAFEEHTLLAGLN
jgi:hypothetical protein